MRYMAAIALCLAACSGGGTSNDTAKVPSAADTSVPPTGCSPPADGGELCSCPGTSSCPSGQDFWFTCSEGGTWEKTDASCVLAGDSDAPPVTLEDDAARQANPGSGDAAALIPDN
jgi:hypothetical protein